MAVLYGDCWRKHPLVKKRTKKEDGGEKRIEDTCTKFFTVPSGSSSCNIMRLERQRFEGRQVNGRKCAVWSTNVGVIPASEGPTNQPYRLDCNLHQAVRPCPR